MTGLLRDALHSNYIGRVHCIPGHVPAAGSCRNTAAGCICHEFRGLDCGAVVIELHLHSIPDQDRGTIVVVQEIPPRSSSEVPVENKLK